MPIPFTLITGFLGSGKSTLLNHLLSNNKHLRIAIIENEFVLEVGIENELVVQKDGNLFREIYEFGGGCVCCSASGEFEQALTELIQKKDSFDHIVLETTGLAIPEPVIRIITQDEEFKENFVLNSVVTVVDSKNFFAQLEDKRKQKQNIRNETLEQILASDLIILNKSDLVSPEESERIEKVIRERNSFCEIIRTTFSQVDTKRLLGSRSFKPEQINSSIFNPAAQHSPDVTPIFIANANSLTLDQFSHWLKDLLRVSKGDIFRSKGLLSIKDEDHVYVLQSVGELFDIRKLEKKWDGKRENKVVLFGYNLDRKGIQESFSLLK